MTKTCTCDGYPDPKCPIHGITDEVAQRHRELMRTDKDYRNIFVSLMASCDQLAAEKRDEGGEE